MRKQKNIGRKPGSDTNHYPVTQVLCVLILTCVSLFACSPNSPVSRVSQALDIQLSDAAVLEFEDTHGGVHNDGTLYCSLSLPDPLYQKLIQELDTSKHWKPLPLTDILNLAVYGGQMNASNSSTTLNEWDMAPIAASESSVLVDPFVKNAKGESCFPPIEHGYYYFCNRNGDDPNAELDLLNAYSHNFTVALLDMDTQTLYYYEYDS